MVSNSNSAKNLLADRNNSSRVTRRVAPSDGDTSSLLEAESLPASHDFVGNPALTWNNLDLNRSLVSQLASMKFSFDSVFFGRIEMELKESPQDKRVDLELSGDWKNEIKLSIWARVGVPRIQHFLEADEVRLAPEAGSLLLQFAQDVKDGALRGAEEKWQQLCRVALNQEPWGKEQLSRARRQLAAGASSEKISPEQKALAERIHFQTKLGTFREEFEKRIQSGEVSDLKSLTKFLSDIKEVVGNLRNDDSLEELKSICDRYKDRPHDVIMITAYEFEPRGYVRSTYFILKEGDQLRIFPYQYGCHIDSKDGVSRLSDAVKGVA